MDYLAFTGRRTAFLRAFYKDASVPFHAVRAKIEAHEEPYADPRGYEDAEPPFLGEWMEAGDAVHVLVQSVASLLSQTLKLYIERWIGELRKRAGDEQLVKAGIGLPNSPSFKSEFKNGWFAGYRAYCRALDIDWSESPADLALLEQLILARNSAQHSTDITSVRARQTESETTRFPNGFFADTFDLRWNESMTPGSRFLLPPHLDISGDKLARALDEVDAFCSWLDAQHPMRRSSHSASYRALYQSS